jgi:hypothetical protein
MLALEAIPGGFAQMEGQRGTGTGGSWRECVRGSIAGALVATLVALIGATASRAEPFLPRVYSGAGAGVAVTAKGVVWADGYRVLYQGFSSSSNVLGGLRETEPTLSSSADAVVLSARGSARGLFSAALPPGRFRPIPQVWVPRRGAGCEWVPSGEAASGGFVVAGEELVNAATCAEELTFQEQAQKQPLFARDVRGGRWHVLRWIPGRASPVLAAEGSRLAVGISSSAQRMRVLVFDLPSARPIAQFDAPAGYLGFASPERLVISALVPRGSRAASAEKIRPIPRIYRAGLYSLGGRRLAALGTLEDLRSSHGCTS